MYTIEKVFVLSIFTELQYFSGEHLNFKVKAWTSITIAHESNLDIHEENQIRIVAYTTLTFIFKTLNTYFQFAQSYM